MIDWLTRVSVNPGMTAFARIPRAPYPAAMTLTIPIAPDLAML
jgi:hypothetical protein